MSLEPRRDLEMLVRFLSLGFAILLLKQESKRVAVPKTGTCPIFPDHDSESRTADYV